MILFQDRRDYQIIFLSCFLFLGLFTRDWSVQPISIGTITLTCLVTQWGLSTIREVNKCRDNDEFATNKTQLLITSMTNSRVLNSLRSSLITALGLCLLLRGNSYQTMMLAGFLAIASKFLFRYRSKHFFNPANFGIVSALLLTNDAWVSPGQWGTDWWYLLLFAGMGGIILQKVGRWDTSVTFLLVYAGLEAIRDAWLGWSGDVWLHQLSSGSLLLFALFMLTDPRSIPNATIGRIFWAIAIAITTVILQDYFYINTAIFWALFIISPLTILFDLVWSAPRFMWNKLLVVSCS
jgi:Na+-transporting NADH:ubiquinone oxidoreductase subunit NqrB